MITATHSFSFALTLFIHICALFYFASLAGNRKVMHLAELEIAALELNLNDASEEHNAPASTPQQSAQPQPKKVPELNTEPTIEPPPPLLPAPQISLSAIPESESVILPELKREPAPLEQSETRDLHLDAPRPDVDALFPETEPRAEQPSEAATQREQISEPLDSEATVGGASSGRIDQPPRPRQNIKPRYPAGARRRGEEGAVTLDVVIDSSGRARQVVVAESSGFKELDEAAKRAVSGARFTPGRHDKKYVESQARLTIIFKLK